MLKTSNNPRKLVDRLERNHKRKARFHAYKEFFSKLKQSVFKQYEPPKANDKNDLPALLGYEYTGRLSLRT